VGGGQGASQRLTERPLRDVGHQQRAGLAGGQHGGQLGTPLGLFIGKGRDQRLRGRGGGAHVLVGRAGGGGDRADEGRADAAVAPIA